MVESAVQGLAGYYDVGLICYDKYQLGDNVEHQGRSIWNYQADD